MLTKYVYNYKLLSDWLIFSGISVYSNIMSKIFNSLFFVRGTYVIFLCFLLLMYIDYAISDNSRQTKFRGVSS